MELYTCSVEGYVEIWEGLVYNMHAADLHESMKLTEFAIGMLVCFTYPMLV